MKTQIIFKINAKGYVAHQYTNIQMQKTNKQKKHNPKLETII